MDGAIGWAEEGLEKLREAFLGLGGDFDRNIQQLTATCGELLGADFALYNRLSEGLLVSIGKWRVPEGYSSVTSPNGRVCEDVIKRGRKGGIYIVKNLPETTYYQTDPNVRLYGLRTYVGYPVSIDNECIGSLCALYKEEPKLSELHEKFLGILASAIGIEEKSKRVCELNCILRESERNYRNLVERANDGIIIIQDTLLKYVNPRMAEIGGYTVEEVINTPFTNYIHPDEVSKVLDIYSKRMANVVYETIIISKDGSERFVEFNSSITSYQGKLAELVIVRDITEKRKMEKEFLKAQKLESIGVLAGGIAHDFNNILTGILGNISLAKMYTTPGDRIFERLTEAEKSADRAKRLTQKLLTFATGGAPIVRTTDIAQLLRDSVSFALSGSNVRSEFFIPGDLWLAEIDDGQMGHAISNVVVNAQQAMPEGGIIEVHAENVFVEAEQNYHLKPGKYVRISIKDHGVGISSRDIPKIFDPYFTTKKDSTGLGLTTTYSIVKRHGGEITVESKEGIGTTVHIYLPASPKQVLPKVQEERVPVPSKGRVLVMDDEEIIRELISAMLSGIGYEVITVNDGIEAIELYKEAKESGKLFDVVIMDLTIPGGMGGKEAIKKLLEIDPEAKAIVSSGYSNDPIMSDFRRYGFQGAIAKPYNVRELIGIVYELMHHRSANKRGTQTREIRADSTA